MSDTLPHLSQLSELVANKNPIARQQKYRQNTIVCCDALTQLDGREVTTKERQYLTHVKRRMAAMGNAMASEMPQVHQVELGSVAEEEHAGIITYGNTRS